MADAFVLVVEGLTSLGSLEELPEKTLTAARIAVNEAARSGRTLAAKEVRSQVNFPAAYVAPSKDRLSITQYATNKNLNATIRARTRNTSLARFVLGNPKPGRNKEGLRVEIKPGVVRRLPGAFLVRLRAGTETNLDTAHNMGLAVRTKDGQMPPSSYKPKELFPNVWLLYGPSVAQILHSASNGKGVADDISGDIADKLESEFWKQMGRST